MAGATADERGRERMNAEGGWMVGRVWWMESATWRMPGRRRQFPPAAYYLPPSTYHPPPTTYHLPPTTSALRGCQRKHCCKRHHGSHQKVASSGPKSCQFGPKSFQFGPKSWWFSTESTSFPLSYHPPSTIHHPRHSTHHPLPTIHPTESSHFRSKKSPVFDRNSPVFHSFAILLRTCMNVGKKSCQTPAVAWRVGAVCEGLLAFAALFSVLSTQYSETGGSRKPRIFAFTARFFCAFGLLDSLIFELVVLCLRRC